MSLLTRESVLKLPPGILPAYPTQPPTRIRLWQENISAHEFRFPNQCQQAQIRRIQSSTLKNFLNKERNMPMMLVRRHSRNRRKISFSQTQQRTTFASVGKTQILRGLLWFSLCSLSCPPSPLTKRILCWVVSNDILQLLASDQRDHDCPSSLLVRPDHVEKFRPDDLECADQRVHPCVRHFSWFPMVCAVVRI